MFATATTPQRTPMMGAITYLLLSFPLGLAYFIIIVTGLSLSLGTLIIWIGVPLLFVTLYAVHGMAELERRVTARLFNDPLPVQAQPTDEPTPSFLQQLGRLVRDSQTWIDVLYLIIKFPLGILNFTLALTLPIVSIALTAAPLAYLVNVFVGNILAHNGIDSDNQFIPYFIEIHGGQFDAAMFARSFLIVPIGVACWFLSRLILLGLANFARAMTYALLGESSR
jgi:hypothetical protein